MKPPGRKMSRATARHIVAAIRRDDHAIPAPMLQLWHVRYYTDAGEVAWMRVRAETASGAIQELWRQHPGVGFISTAAIPGDQPPPIERESAAQAAPLHSGAERRPGEEEGTNTTIDNALTVVLAHTAAERKRLAGERL